MVDAEGGYEAAAMTFSIRVGPLGASPLDRPDGAGLLWAINGGRLVELRREWAVIELAENGSQRIVDRRRLDVVSAVTADAPPSPAASLQPRRWTFELKSTLRKHWSAGRDSDAWIGLTGHPNNDR